MSRSAERWPAMVYGPPGGVEAVMRVILSTIGTRGEVQPLLALALAFRDRGDRATLCAPPDFGAWITEAGVDFVPLGPELRRLNLGAIPAKAPSLPPEQLRKLAAEGTVRAQLATLGAAVPGHDLVLGAGTLQIAARSLAEAHGARYVFAGYCPLVLPSRLQPPVKMGMHHPLTLSEGENAALWAAEETSWDALFGPALNEGRAALGLPPVEGVLAHLLGELPWLAVDPVLGPAPADRAVVQPGAWRLADPTPLPEALERFLDAGDPPIYLGLGSNLAPPETGRALLEAARAVGRRAILSRGWAELSGAEPAEDWLSVGDVAHDALFPRVCAVVHHGGAGTTTTAAAAGRPQVLLPHHYDQNYWGARVEALGVGVAASIPRPVPADMLAGLLEAALRPEIAASAAALAPRIVRDGARVTAERLREG